MSSGEDVFVCEVCGEGIHPGERIVRVAADTCDSDELLPSESLVFAVFHSSCVVDTYRSGDCDEVPYMEEAREAIVSSPLCECCRRKLQPADSRPRFTLLRGGLR